MPNADFATMQLEKFNADETRNAIITLSGTASIFPLAPIVTAGAVTTIAGVPLSIAAVDPSQLLIAEDPTSITPLAGGVLNTTGCGDVPPMTMRSSSQSERRSTGWKLSSSPVTPPASLAGGGSRWKRQPASFAIRRSCSGLRSEI